MLKPHLNTPAQTGKNRIEVVEDRQGRFKIVLEQDEAEGRGTLVIEQGAYGPWLSFVTPEGEEKCFALVDLFHNSELGASDDKGPLSMCLYNPNDDNIDTPAFVRFLNKEGPPLVIETEPGMMDYDRNRSAWGDGHTLTLNKEFYDEEA